MKNRSTIKDELNELNSGLNPDSNGTPFSVPEGYFDGLATAVLAKIRGGQAVSSAEEMVELSPLLAGISRKLPYSVPDGFFQSNVEGLQGFTSENEASLVLSFIDKQMPYEVPSDYFASLPERVLEKLNDPGAKVVPLRRKWIRLAVAAMFTGLLVLSGIFYLKTGGHSNNGGTAPVPVAVELKKASTEELNDFINSTAIDITDEKAPVTAKNHTSKKETMPLFDDVSDKDLESFLNQVPTDDDEPDIN